MHIGSGGWSTFSILPVPHGGGLSNNGTASRFYIRTDTYGRVRQSRRHGGAAGRVHGMKERLLEALPGRNQAGPVPASTCRFRGGAGGFAAGRPGIDRGARGKRAVSRQPGFRSRVTYTVGAARQGGRRDRSRGCGLIKPWPSSAVSIVNPPAAGDVHGLWCVFARGTDDDACDLEP